MFSFQGSDIPVCSGDGDGEIRTLDPLLARQVLSQLSYTPIYCHKEGPTQWEDSL